MQALLVQTPAGGVDFRGGVVHETRNPSAPAYVQAMAPPKFFNAAQLLRLQEKRTDRIYRRDEGQAWAYKDEVAQEVLGAIAQGAEPAEALDHDVQRYLQRSAFRDEKVGVSERPKVGKSKTLRTLVDRREARVRDALFGTVGGALPGEDLLVARERRQRNAKFAQQVPRLE